MNKLRVPDKYKTLFKPVFDLKMMLQSNKDTLDINKSEQIIISFMLTHYLTFFITQIAQYNKSIDKSIIYPIRYLIEDILSGNGYKLNDMQIRNLISFCDKSAKYINTTSELYLTICNYEAYQNYSIYSMLHHDKKIFDFKYFCMLNEETIKSMKQYHAAAIAVLNVIPNKLMVK